MVSREPPAPYRSVTPRMFVSDVENAVEFLRNVFGAAAQIEPGRPTDVHLGDSVVLISSTAQRGPFPSFLYVYVEDVDTTYQQAMRTGASSLEGPLDTPYGDRRATFQDGFGNIYQVAHPLRDDS